MKKYRLKKDIKEAIKTMLTVIILTALFTSFLMFYCNRIEKINNNKDGYTESGRSHSVNVQINYKK